jgi:ubiquinone/menaquinone biosynthesis C-methylase UbiE
MGFYERVIFNRAMEFALDRPQVNAERARVLGAVRGRILEVGMGTGLNLENYPAGVGPVTAANLEPELDSRAERRAAARGLQVEVVKGDATVLPFADQSFDSVVCTFLLCSVSDPDRALCEFRRVLAPEGQLFFIEHVKSAKPLLAFAQRALDPVQRTFACGCSLVRDTERAIERAGFEFLELRRREDADVPWWLGTVISGVAEVHSAPPGHAARRAPRRA